MMKKVLLTMVVCLITTIAFAQSNYQDVVYLKNGSVIRGVIIEQVPNESLKITTTDGNLFVYKIGEVEKIAKEQIVPQTPQSVQPKSQLVQQQSPANSQPIQQEERITQWGIKGGLNMAQEITDDDATDTRTGIHIGFFVEVPINNRVSFQPELVYSMQGGSSKVKGTTITDKLDYINIPLMFKFYVMQQRLSIEAGLQFGYLISAKVSGEGMSIDADELFNEFDTSIGLGLSYKVTDKFDLSMRFNVGMTKLVDDYTNRNNVFQLGVGYRF